MKKILIADEFSFGRQLFAFALRHYGYEVSTAEDGLGVIDALQREKPDLVIMDARLPKIDGLAVLRMMRGTPDFKEIPVFLLTGVENRQQILQAVQIGVQEYILKSRFDLDALLGRIRKCIGPAGGLSSRPAIAEVWEEVHPPAGTVHNATLEIPGDMETAPGAQKVSG